MLGASDLSAVFGSGADPYDHAAMRDYIRECARLGLHILLVKPDTKEPFDGRTARARTAADRKAQEEAREAGLRGWDKVKSPSGLDLATDDFTKLDGYLKQYIKVFGADVAVNLAIEVGGSGVIVVDCDTTEQRERFIESTGSPMDLPPMVITPGTERGGETIHYDGGHFYFLPPEGWERPTNMGSYTWPGEHGFAVLWHRRYVLIPPSVRPEGIYELVGREYTAPQWLLDEIEQVSSVRAVHARDHSFDPVDKDLNAAIVEWSLQTSWESILAPLGWVPMARTDTCGCEIWTAPGSHANPKSATAHDAGCSSGRFSEVNGPLHIWTDHDIEPFGEYVRERHTSTMSKLQAVSIAFYEGDIGKTMDSLGIAADPVTLSRADIDAQAGGTDPLEEVTLPTPEQPFDIPLDDAAEEPAEEATESPFATAADTDDEDDNTFPGKAAPVSDIFGFGERDLPTIAPFSHWRDMPPPEYVIEGLVEHAATTCIIGAPGAGKSCVALDMALSIACGVPWQGRKTMRTKVLYLPGEGLSGTVQRVKAWGLVHDIPDEIIDDWLRLGDDVLRVTAKTEMWGLFGEYLVRENIGLVVVDTFARSAIGLEENSATDVGRAIFRFDAIRRLSGVGVMLVHHTGKGSPTVGRGSSALNAALESELLVTSAAWDDEDGEAPSISEAMRPINIQVTKQKNAPLLEKPIPLSLVECEAYSAPYVANSSGGTDPMVGTPTPARPIEEPTIETAIRLYEFLTNLPEQGATRSELFHGVRPDRYTKTRKDSERFWKTKVNLAVDLGLRFGLIETLSGKDTGMRYITSSVTPAAARTRNAAEVMGDPDNP